MLKLFLLAISSFLFLNACSIKNPLSDKSKVIDKLKLDKKTFEDGIKAFIAIN
jgi:hypothetical protein